MHLSRSRRLVQGGFCLYYHNLDAHRVRNRAHAVLNCNNRFASFPRRISLRHASKQSSMCLVHRLMSPFTSYTKGKTMKCQRVFWASACLVVVSTVILSDASLALAQRKWRPNMYDRWGQNRAQRSLRHARDYARDLHYYSRDVETVQPNVAKAESENIGKNIEAAQQELAAARKQAGDDKETVAALEAIETHLANAAKVHQMLHKECLNDSVDAGVSMECCNEITKELEKAMAEHAALLRRLDPRAEKGTAPTDK